MNARGRLFVQGAVQALMRMVFLVLMYRGLTAKHGLAAAGFLAGAIGVLVFVLMPGRICLGQTMGETHGRKAVKRPWKTVLKLGCGRLLRGLLYSLPVMILMGWFLYSHHTASGTEFGMTIKRFSYFLFMRPEKAGAVKGLIGFCVPVVLLALYALLGWRQDMPLEYVQGETAAEALGKCKKVRHAGSKALWKVSLGNAGLMFASFAAMAVVFGLYAWPRLAAAEDLFALLQAALDLLEKPLPGGWLAALGAVYLLMAAPLCMLRKARVCRAVTKTEQGM